MVVSIMKTSDTLIIIPAYNEALNIEKTVNDVITNTNYDYIIINLNVIIKE